MATAPIHGTQRAGSMAHSLHVLVVDDEVHLREILRNELEGAGHQVATCDCGKAALQQFRDSARKFDAVLTDVRMPDGDGLWLLGELQKSSHPPAVFLITGFADLGVNDAKQRGAVDVFDKPFEFDVIIARLAALPRLR